MDNNQNINNKDRYETRKQKRLEEKNASHGNPAVKSFLAWAGIFVLVVGSVCSLVYFVGTGKNNTGSQTALLIGAISPTDWLEGNKDSKTIVVEYGDYQCPACAAYHTLTKQLATDFKDKIALVYRNFPLREIHKYADLSAQTAEAAGKQGKFWEMHDLLYENQKTWAESNDAKTIFLGYAKSLDLNMDQFQKDLDSDSIKNKIEADLQSGIKAGIQGTPTFFINGKSIVNPQSYDEFKNLINASSS